MLEVLYMSSGSNEDIKKEAGLKNYSQVYSLNRLSDPDSETVAGITAGGDKGYLEKDINDYDEP
jgi:hypothetical protein